MNVVARWIFIALFVWPLSAPASQCLEIFFKAPVWEPDFWRSAEGGFDHEAVDAFVLDPKNRILIEHLMLGETALQMDPTYQRRDQELLSRGTELVRSRASHQLVIINQGFTHSRIFYEHAGPQPGIAYLSPSFVNFEDNPLLRQLQATFPLPEKLKPSERQLIFDILTSGLRRTHPQDPLMEDIRALLGFEDSKSFEDQGIIMQLQFLTGARNDTFSYEGPLLSELPSVILLNDFHNRASPAFLEQLPSVEDLRAAGMTEVVIAIEGLPVNERHPLLRVEKLFYQNILEVYRASLSNSKRRDLARRLALSPHLRAFQKDFDTRIVVNPLAYALVRWAREHYLPAGIDVRIVGL